MTAENDQVSVAVLRQDAPDVTMHWLPCAIDQTGEAPVAAYFMPQDSATGKHRPFLDMQKSPSVPHALVLECAMRCCRHLRSWRRCTGGSFSRAQAAR